MRFASHAIAAAALAGLFSISGTAPSGAQVAHAAHNTEQAYSVKSRIVKVHDHDDYDDDYEEEAREWRRRHYHRHHAHSDRYVEAPYAYVETRRRRVIVEAPFTDVYVGRRGRHIRAPFVNLWIPR